MKIAKIVGSMCVGAVTVLAATLVSEEANEDSAPLLHLIAPNR